jgi:hypothetical protein
MAGVLERMRRSKKQLVKPWSSLAASSSKVLELQTAKEILAEVFHVRPSMVEDMLLRRLEERSQAVEQGPLSEDGLWPATFCLGE